MKGQNHDPEAIARARKLRRRMGVTESLAWDQLRDRNMHFKFRRQVPFGPYVLDFYCYEAKLCVELDGEQHENRRVQDEVRDQYLADQGIMTFRINTVDFIEGRFDLLESIFELCVQRTGRNPRVDLA